MADSIVQGIRIAHRTKEIVIMIDYDATVGSSRPKKFFIFELIFTGFKIMLTLKKYSASARASKKFGSELEFHTKICVAFCPQKRTTIYGIHLKYSAVQLRHIGS